MLQVKEAAYQRAACCALKQKVRADLENPNESGHVRMDMAALFFLLKL